MHEFKETGKYATLKGTKKVCFILRMLKGNVKEGTKQIYKNPWAMGSFHITVGKVYLFTYYDDANSTDVFEVITYDTRTLKLKHVEGSMWDNNNCDRACYSWCII